MTKHNWVRTYHLSSHLIVTETKVPRVGVNFPRQNLASKAEDLVLSHHGQT